jgi:hypothetical protein
MIPSSIGFRHRAETDAQVSNGAVSQGSGLGFPTTDSSLTIS